MSEASRVEHREPAPEFSRYTGGVATVLDELVELLSLERIEENLYRGQSQDLGWGTVYGGQVIGQALFAALHTVPTDR